MLKQRVITALILAPIAIAAIFLFSKPYFSLFASVVLLIATWEWSNIMRLEGVLFRGAYVALMAMVMWLAYPMSTTMLCGLGVLWWLIALRWVLMYPKGEEQWGKFSVLGLMGFLVIIPAWKAIIELQAIQSNGPWILMYVMILVWGADTGAYFAGRKFGKTKLAPAVSPGKSIAGVVGGLLLTLGLAVIIGFNLDLSIGQWISFLFVSALTVLSSVLGDLLESMVKRFRGIKDSSQILPGHGGVLDRLDSLTAALPVFAAGYFLIGGWM